MSKLEVQNDEESRVVSQVEIVLIVSNLFFTDKMDSRIYQNQIKVDITQIKITSKER